MRFTSRQDLPCLEGTDMAAVALYMQCLAEQVESTLVADSAAYTSFLNPPVAVWTNTVNQATLADRDFFTFNTVSSNNWPTVPSATAPSLPNVRGWYYIGANANIVDPTAPVANEYRAIVLTATQNAGITGDPVIGSFTSTELESATTNGENILVAGTVFFASGDFSDPDPVDLELQYRTSTSVLDPATTTQTPAIRLWVVYLGDTPEIGVF